MSIATKLAKLKTIKQDIKSALEEKGQTPSNVFSTYANNIRAIEIGGGSSSDDPRINRSSNYPEIPLPSQITETEDVVYFLLDATSLFCFLNVYVNTGTGFNYVVEKYNNNTLVKTEEAVLIESGQTLTLYFGYDTDNEWDTYNYIRIKLVGNISNLNFQNISAVNRKYEYQGIIEISGKCSSCILNFNSDSSYAKNCFKNIEYFSFKGFDIGSYYGQSSSSYGFYELDTICYGELELIKNASQYVSDLFKENKRLISMPNLINFNSEYSAGMFNACTNINEIDFTSYYDYVNAGAFAYNCNSVRHIKITGNYLSNVYNAFNGCKLVTNINVPKLGNNVNTIYQCFNNCYNLQETPNWDLSNVTTTTNAFKYCYSLVKFNMYGMKVSFSLSDSTLLSESELVKIFNNLADLTNSSSQTLTLGTTLLAKLTDEEKAIATNKNWTLA